MSYAGPSGQKNTARPPLKRAPAPRPSTASNPTSTERNVAFLAGVIVGATVGVGVALLLAPQSGRSTRRRLLRKGQRVTRRGGDVWEDLGDALRDALERRREARQVRKDAPTNGAQRKSFSLRAASSL
ncbi:MAG TPA: YtxH domain-containing protein [Gemmatimonadaceae bacterium]|jgi:gas vesicle protein